MWRKLLPVLFGAILLLMGTVSVSFADGRTPPAGWREVDHDFAGNTTQTWLHDPDGALNRVFLTWYRVSVQEGSRWRDLGICSVNATVGPRSQRVRSNRGGWREFEFQEAIASMEEIRRLTNWWVDVLKNEPGECYRQSYAIAYQARTGSGRSPTQPPGGWIEVAHDFAGDVSTRYTHDPAGRPVVFLTWFWVQFPRQRSGQYRACSMRVTDAREEVWTQGGYRAFMLQDGSQPTRGQIWELSLWWTEAALETEGDAETQTACGHPGAYTIYWQNANLDPGTPNGRPPSDGTAPAAQPTYLPVFRDVSRDGGGGASTDSVGDEPKYGPPNYRVEGDCIYPWLCLGMYHRPATP